MPNDKQSKIEKASKAIHSADFLIQDLQELNMSSDVLVSLLVIPEIAQLQAIKSKLESILVGLSYT